jgi:hypothetical protein
MKGEIVMNLTAPKNITWWIALILGVLGLIGTIVSAGFLTTYAFWLILVAWVLLLLGTLLKGL